MKITATNSGDDNVAERNGWRTTKGSTIEGMCGMGGDKIQWVPFDLDRWIKWNQPHKLFCGLILSMAQHQIPSHVSVVV